MSSANARSCEFQMVSSVRTMKGNGSQSSSARSGMSKVAVQLLGDGVSPCAHPVSPL